MPKFSLLLKRLSVMKPAEITHRVGELAHIKRRQVEFNRGRLQSKYQDVDSGALAFCTSSKPLLPRLPFGELTLGPELDGWLAGRWPALGFDWMWDPEGECWNQAPDTGRAWPRDVFFGSIDYREGNAYGDVRVAWEPARLQQLISLSLAARSSEALRDQALAKLEQILVSWVAHNPPGSGIHYISVMECALRILSVTYAVDMARPFLNSTSAVWPAVAQLVYSHADLTAQRLSLHSSTGNHTTCEAVGLLHAGLLFPELPGAEAWTQTALDLLSREADHQILPDGGGAERSPWYHLQVVDMFGLAEELLKFNHVGVPPSVQQAVRRGRGFLASLGAGPGELPPFNDSDHGYALSPHLNLSWSGSADPEPVLTFPDTGLTRIRQTGSEIDLLFDHGPLGLDPLYAHGHADALSVILTTNGEPLWVDPGTFMYTGGGAWRTYFRSTRAHNTVQVDQVDQATQSTPFLWTSPYSAELIRSETDEQGVTYLLGRHHGYASRGVVHWRGVVVAPQGAVLILDALRGTGVHELDLHWHLGGQPELRESVISLHLQGRPWSMKLTGGEATLHRGEESPPLGWASTLYGTKTPLTTVRLSHRGALPHDMTTVLWTGEEPSSAGYLETVRSWIDS